MTGRAEQLAEEMREMSEHFTLLTDEHKAGLIRERLLQRETDMYDLLLAQEEAEYIQDEHQRFKVISHCANEMAQLNNRAERLRMMLREVTGG